MLRSVSCVAMVASSVLLGCGSAPEGPKRVPVSGQVTYAGDPIEDGKIRFVPIENTDGPLTTALIKDGEYSADSKGGVPVGTHRVEVEAYRPKEGAEPVSPELAEDFSDLEVGQLPQEQFLPEEYAGERSTLRLVVESGSGPIVKNFDLEQQ